MALYDPYGSEIVYKTDDSDRNPFRHVKDPNGHFVPAVTLVDHLGAPMGMDEHGPLTVSDIYLNLARNTTTPGKLPGMIRVNIRGFNSDVDSGSLPEDLWGGGGAYVFPTGATAMEAVSSSANDAAAGTGARTIRVDGLDASYEPLQETLTLNGVNPVALVNNFFRINEARILTAGSLMDAAGTVTIRASGGGTSYAVIPQGEGFTAHGVYTVRAGYTLYLVASLFAIVRDNGVTTSRGTFQVRTRNSISGTEPWRVRWRIPTSGDAPARFPTEIPHPMSAGTDIVVRISNVSTDSLFMSTHLQGIMIDNTL
jgi:hypothetical protein